MSTDYYLDEVDAAAESMARGLDTARESATLLGRLWAEIMGGNPRWRTPGDMQANVHSPHYRPRRPGLVATLENPELRLAYWTGFDAELDRQKQADTDARDQHDVEYAYSLGNRDALAKIRHYIERGRPLDTLSTMTPMDPPKEPGESEMDVLKRSPRARQLPAAYRRGYNDTIRAARSAT